MAYSALPRIEGAAHGVNYGFDRVRFVRPVPSGSRVRGHFTLRAVDAPLGARMAIELRGQRGGRRGAEAGAGGDLAHDAGDGLASQQQAPLRAFPNLARLEEQLGMVISSAIVRGFNHFQWFTSLVPRRKIVGIASYSLGLLSAYLLSIRSLL